MAWPKDIFKRKNIECPCPLSPASYCHFSWAPFFGFFVSGHWHRALFAVKLFAQEFKTIKRRTALSTAVALRKTSIHSCVLKIHSQGQRFAYNFWTDPRTKPTKNPAHTREKASAERQTSRQRSRAKPKLGRNLGQEKKMGIGNMWLGGWGRGNRTRLRHLSY